MREMSLAHFVTELGMMSSHMRAETHHALEHIGRAVEAEAKREIGHYQAAAGPFAAWAGLAAATKADRVRRGFSENDPGLRTGAMRDSIGHTVTATGDGGEVVIGSNDDHLVYFELGTSKQPPRSVLGAAAVHKVDEIKRVAGEAAVKALVGPGVFRGRLPIE